MPVDMVPRSCPVCAAGGESRIFLEARYDFARLDGYGFASRKTPEYMHLRLLECARCDVVYADPVPTRTFLEAAYRDAAFDAGAESAFAARTYGRLIDRMLDHLPDREGALDIGTGDGAFLVELLQRGFRGVRGVEPSAAPAAAAVESARALILQRPFRAEDFDASSLQLVTCFQTIEHLADPLDFVRGAHGLLRDGGALVLVCHDRRSPVTRVLGRRSPIFDVEHLQLFSPASARRLLEAAGFVDVQTRPVVNRYPLRYWLRLAPVPGQVKAALQGALTRTGLAMIAVSLPVGNLGVVGFRRGARR